MVKLLPFTPGRLALLAAPVAALTGVSYLLNPRAWSEAEWWVYAALGGFFVVVLVMPLVMKSRAWLKLDREGMHVQMLLRGETFRWRDIESFAAVELDHSSVPMARFVGINFHGNPPKMPAILAPLMKRVNGYHRSVPAWFGGLNAEELRALLEEWRAMHSK